MTLEYPTDKFIHLCGFATSVAEAKRLRLAGAVWMAPDGEELVKITTPYVRFCYPDE